MKPNRSTVVGWALAVLACWVVEAHAITFDHLECYKIKDPLKAKYTATLTPEQVQFLTQTGCQIKAPAKFFCIDVEKSNVQPTPPMILGGQTTRDYLCYKLKCIKNQIPVPVEDQFGQRTITIKKADHICAPAHKIGFPFPATPTPCLAPTPTKTSTPQPPTCTDGIQNDSESGVDCGGAPSTCPLCPNGQGCFSNSNCLSNFCQAGQCQAAPMCMPPFADCNGMPGDGCEVNTSNDPNNCGACGNFCPPRPNAVASCTSSNCTFICNAGYADCNAMAADGCETSITNNNTNCGGCGLVCPGVTMCVGNVCQ